VLEEIRLLSGLETYQEKILNVILVGQPELNDLLNSPGMEQLVQRVRLRFHIKPFDQVEMHSYIANRLKVAGAKQDAVFAPEAYPLLFRYTGGTPRLINSLCDTALICAYADGLPQVSEAVVMTAVEELQWSTYEERMARNRAQPPPPQPVRTAVGGEGFHSLSEEIQRIEERVNQLASYLGER
jgi:hypothetical protein